MKLNNLIRSNNFLLKIYLFFNHPITTNVRRKLCRTQQQKKEKSQPVTEATILLKVGNRVEHTAALGKGPVNALDNALRKALQTFYPDLKTMDLVDYKVRVLSTREGTGAPTRVLIESSDGKHTWGTVGVSENIIEASWRALVDSIDYKLLIEKEKK